MSNKADITEKALMLEYAFDRGVDILNRIIVIDDDIEEGSFRWLDASLTLLERSSQKKITIKLSTFGGCTYEARAIAARILASPRNITIEAYGKVMSAGILIFASGDKRRLSRHAVVMHHGASYSTGFNKHEVNKETILQMQSEERQFCKFLEDLTGTSATLWEEASKHSDTYLTPQQAIDWKLADELF